MIKYTQSQLKGMVSQGIAEDITYSDNSDRDAMAAREQYYTQVGYSSGLYGCNGMLFKGHNTGTLYAITSRSQAIWIY